MSSKPKEKDRKMVRRNKEYGRDFIMSQFSDQKPKEVSPKKEIKK